jgi:hypothetical protein
MRFGINYVAGWVRTKVGSNPMSGNVFVVLGNPEN